MSNLSRYPDGTTGAALLFIRLSSATVVLPALGRVFVTPTLGTLPWLIGAAMIGALIGGTCMRSAATLLILVLCIAIPVAGADAALLSAPVGGAVALILLGPGAHSIEAHLFGRRVIRMGRLPSGRGNDE